MSQEKSVSAPKRKRIPVESPFMLTDEVVDRTTYSRQHLETLIAAGEFPAPVKIGIRRIAYIRVEVNDWIASKIASRRVIK